MKAVDGIGLGRHAVDGRRMETQWMKEGWEGSGWKKDGKAVYARGMERQWMKGRGHKRDGKAVDGRGMGRKRTGAADGKMGKQ